MEPRKLANRTKRTKRTKVTFVRVVTMELTEQNEQDPYKGSVLFGSFGDLEGTALDTHRPRPAPLPRWRPGAMPASRADSPTRCGSLERLNLYADGLRVRGL